MRKNILLANLLGSQNLLEILQTSITFTNSEKVVKSRCFDKLLQWRTPIFFRNDGVISSLLCKNTDVLLNYQEVGIYIKYNTPHALSELVKMW